MDCFTKDRLLIMVKKDTIPAMGCTEPIAVAYATSVARKYLEGPLEKIQVFVSKNIYKNGKSVIIPYTNECGLDLAAALGAIGGQPDKGLMVLKNLKREDIAAANKLVGCGKVSVNIEDKSPHIYVDVILKNDKNKTEVTIKNSHDRISSIKVNEDIIFNENKEDINSKSDEFLKKLNFKEIRKICEEIDIQELSFIEEGIIMNKDAAKKGLAGNKGLGIGTGLLKLINEKKVCNTAPMMARTLTAAAADFRMGGGDCPIMTSAGSGNQGLGVILPIVVVAEENNIEKEKLMRTIFFAHIINKYVKIFTGKLSAMCGCAVAAGIGASAGITWLLGGNDKQISGACQNMLSNLTGMICDGAKETCALKLSTSAEEAVLSAYLAMENIIVKPKVGIIADTIEETIKNVGILCNDGLIDTDTVILEILK